MDVNDGSLPTASRPVTPARGGIRAGLGAIVIASLLLIGPTVPASAADPPCPTPTTAPASTAPMTVAQRTQLFEVVWRAIETRSADPSHGGVDWAAIKEEFAPRIAAASTEGEVDTLLTEMVGRLGDQAVYWPRSVDQPSPGPAGIGIVYAWEPAEERIDLRVLYVMPGGPADRAGLHERDRILAIDGDSCMTGPTSLRGEPGTSVELLVRSPGCVARYLTVEREEHQLVVTPETRVVTADDGRRTGYLRVPNLDQPDAGHAVVVALNDLLANGPLDAIVLDLRWTWGSNDGAIDTIAGQFLSGVVAHVHDRDGTTDWTLPAGELSAQLEDTHLVVAIDHHTSGPAELLAGILHGSGRAVTIGEPTTGDSKSYQGIDLSGGRWLSLLTPIDVPPGDTPITPVPVDVFVPGDGLSVREEDDPVLAKALDSSGGYSGSGDLIPLATPAPACWSDLLASVAGS